MTGRSGLAVVLLIAALVLTLPITAFSGDRGLRLSSTTSTDNTGLLEYILKPFEKRTGIKVHVIAVGTGKALKLAENGDVDISLIHAPTREKLFVEKGFGVNRRVVMANYFVIVGPADDPAGIAGAKDEIEAFKRIAKSKTPFISRGDDSGTHIKEVEIWRKALGKTPDQRWYMETGSGIGATLTIADEKRAYTLTDKGSFLKYLGKVDLKGLFEKQSAMLYNPYGVIAVNPARHPHARYEDAMRLIAWLTSVEGQKMIGEFKDETGKAIFTPLAVPCKK